MRTPGPLPLWGWLLAGYLAVLALIGFWPTPVDAPAQGLLADVLSRLHSAGVPGWFSYSTVEATANVLLFVPLGLAATLGLRSNWRQTVVLGALASASMELGQLLFLQHRFPSLIDVATNTFGTLLGFLLARTFTYRRNDMVVS